VLKRPKLRLKTECMKAECPKMKINGCQEHKYCNKNNPTENDFDYT
jgi:hypothetical protein